MKLADPSHEVSSIIVQGRFSAVARIYLGRIKPIMFVFKILAKNDHALARFVKRIENKNRPVRNRTISKYAEKTARV